MLSGGSHSMIHPFGVTGFNLLDGPFDQQRRSEEGVAPVRSQSRRLRPRRRGRHAGARRAGTRQGRGATIYAELTGYGSTADAFRMTDSHPEGRGAIACIRGALEDARAEPDAIGYINAHGTSTKVNDQAESLAIKKVFGDAAYQMPISSSKSMLGHLIAAAGAVELITSSWRFARRLAADDQLRDARSRVRPRLHARTSPGRRRSITS